MQKKNIILLVSVILALGIIFVGILGIIDAPKNTITFDTNGGSMDKTQIRIKCGSGYELPSPTKSGFVFGGWYYNGEYVETIGDNWKYDIDLTLVAEWIIRDEDSFVYEETENGYTIVDYRGIASSEIIVPYEFNSLKVVSIKDGAFSKLSKILTSNKGEKVKLFIKDDISYNSQNLGISDEIVDLISYSYIGEDNYYYLDKGSQLEVVNFSGSYEKDIIVPMKYNEKPVVKIAEDLFNGAGAKVTQGGFSYPRILIPNTINEIGKNAFANCNGIKVSLYHYNNEGKLREIIDLSKLFAWSENLTLEDGNGELLDVISQIRPAFGWSSYTAAKLYIKLDANGGIIPNNVEGITVTIRSKFDLPTPTREGYTFAGWYYGEQKVPQSGERWEFVKHIKLTAKWTENWK